MRILRFILPTTLKRWHCPVLYGHWLPCENTWRQCPQILYLVVLLSQTLSGLPDQDTFYDVVDCLEELGIAAVSQRHLNKKGTDLDLVEQFNIYEVTECAFLRCSQLRQCSSLGS